MKLVVGIGNPEPKYELTRHNAGFLLLDQLSLAWRIPLSSKKFQGIYGRGDWQGQEVILLKPMTYMNRSGTSVGELARFFKIEPADTVVVHDDVDVPQGKVKTRLAGGPGGHNGIRSIIAAFGSDSFPRIKLGLGRPPANWQTDAWVLGQMSDEERRMIETMVPEVCAHLLAIWKQLAALK